MSKPGRRNPHPHLHLHPTHTIIIISPISPPPMQRNIGAEDQEYRAIAYCSRVRVNPGSCLVPSTPSGVAGNWGEGRRREETPSGEVDSRDRLFSGGHCSAVAYRVQRVNDGTANTTADWQAKRREWLQLPPPNPLASPARPWWARIVRIVPHIVCCSKQQGRHRRRR